MSTPTVPATLTGSYTIDPAHSRIGFVARHAMVTKVRGSFNEFDGSGYFDAANPANSKLQLSIKAASIDTRNADRDAHLRSNDFFDMDTYPQITFSSISVEQTGDVRFRVTGDLTIKGVTRPVTSTSSTPAARWTPMATSGSAWKERLSSTARTGVSTGTRRSRPAACSSARASPWSSTCPPSAVPASPPEPT